MELIWNYTMNYLIGGSFISQNQMKDKLFCSDTSWLPCDLLCFPDTGVMTNVVPPGTCEVLISGAFVVWHQLYFQLPQLLTSVSSFELICWSQFHLGELQGETTFVAIPYRSLTIDFVSQVLSVQVGVMTTLVPPGTCVDHSTVARPLVIISVLGTKRHVVMIR